LKWGGPSVIHFRINQSKQKRLGSTSSHTKHVEQK
jgi:hypothetical protein